MDTESSVVLLTAVYRTLPRMLLASLTGFPGAVKSQMRQNSDGRQVPDSLVLVRHFISSFFLCSPEEVCARKSDNPCGHFHTLPAELNGGHTLYRQANERCEGTVYISQRLHPLQFSKCSIHCSSDPCFLCSSASDSPNACLVVIMRP